MLVVLRPLSGLDVNRHQTLLRLPPELHARLREAALERDVSINWLMVKAIEEFLPRLIPTDEFSRTRDTP